MDARKQWHDDDECCDAMDESEEPSQPPRGVPDQRERRRVQQSEDLAVHEVDEEPDYPRAVGIFDHDRPEHQWQVHARQSEQLAGHHDARQHHRRDEPEGRPPRPVHGLIIVGPRPVDEASPNAPAGLLEAHALGTRPTIPA